jgi:high affinity sulfate transporter 1
MDGADADPTPLSAEAAPSDPAGAPADGSTAPPSEPGASGGDGPAGARIRQVVVHYVPIVSWLPVYPADWRRADLVAALTSWGVMVPVAMGYAALAGVPPEYGLITAFAALTAYAIFGTSRHLRITTSSTMAIMSASVVGPLAGGDADRYLALTAGLALVVGAILLAAGLVRLGFIADFLAKSVVTGFIFGLAITIIVGQLPKLLGVPGGGDGTIDQVQVLLDNLPDTNPWTLAVGAGALALILVLRRISRKIPGSLVALVLGILAVEAFDLEVHDVSVVGEIQTGIPIPGLPNISILDLPFLAAGAAGIVFLAVGESLGAGRAFAARHRYEIDADQELVALGAANLSTGLFGGFTVDASLSQSATAESAGTRSQLSSIVTAALILATAVLLAPLFENLPNAVLGAIVIAAVLSLMDVGELRRYAATRRTDFILAIVALVAVVTTTVLVGLVFAVLLSLMLVLYRASRPYVARVGKLSGERGTYVDLERHPEAEEIPGLLMLRIDAPLYFFNVNVARSAILEAVGGSDPRPSAVLLDVGATADFDVTTADIVRQLIGELHDQSIEVSLAQVKGPVRDRMRRMGLMEMVGEDRVYLSVAAAVQDYRHRSE